MFSLEFKDLNDVQMFKSDNKKWEPRQCKCTLYLPYMGSIGYVNINTVNVTITSASF